MQFRIGTFVAAAALVGIAAFAGASVEDTPFADLVPEVDQRFTAASGKAKRKLRSVMRELRRVDRGLKRDLRSAQKINAKLGRVFPGDATIDGLLDGVVLDYAGEVSNLLFDAEETQVQADPLQRRRVKELLELGRQHELAAATAPDRGLRIRSLRRAAKKAIAAEKAIAFVPPEPVEPTGDPLPDTSGQVAYTVNGLTQVTRTVDASLHVASSFFWDLRLTAAPGTAEVGELSIEWTRYWTQSVVAVGSGDGEAVAVIRRGNVVFDQNTSGEVRVTSLGGGGNQMPGRSRMTGTYRVSASSAGGQQITVTGTFDITDMPFTRGVNNQGTK